MADFRNHRPIAEINIVPYIDVMLVLLIIFMVTVPLIQQGVEIDLPQASAESLEQPTEVEPLIITVDRRGRFFINQGQRANQAIDEDLLLSQVTAIISSAPAVPVYVRGDRSVAYEHVMTAMITLQKAGADDIGLITRPPEN